MAGQYTKYRQPLKGFGFGHSTGDYDLMRLLEKEQTGVTEEVLPSILNRLLPTGVSEEVPIQPGYSDESGTYNEYGQLIDYLNKARYEGRTQEDWRNISEPSGMAHDAIDSEIMKDTVKNNPSLMKFLLQKYLFSQ